MRTWEYPHAIEYNLVHEDGCRTHEHSELVDDQGWCLRRSDMSREDYLVYYTRACAEDFLHRIRADPGTWIVAVYRLDHPGGRTPICSIRLTFRGNGQRPTA